MRVAPFLLAVLVLAGCSGAPQEGGEGDQAATPSATVAPDGGPANGTANGAAPRWQVGQSWTWRVQSAAMAGALEAKTAVLGFDGTAYRVGAPDPDDLMALYPFHLLGLGPVDAATLAWQTHGTPVQLVRFPLTDGDRFNADFWSAAAAEVEVLAAEVEGPDGPEPGFRSTVRYTGSDAVFMEADYAPARGQFVRVATYFGDTAPFAEARLVGEGINATGEPFLVTDLARWTARADDPTTLTPRTFTVPGDTDSVLLACFVSGVGTYRALLATPGATASCEAQGQDTTQYAWARTSSGDGDGHVAANAGGPGTITVEVFAIDIGG